MEMTTLQNHVLHYPSTTQVYSWQNADDEAGQKLQLSYSMKPLA